MTTDTEPASNPGTGLHRPLRSPRLGAVLVAGAAATGGVVAYLRHRARRGGIAPAPVGQLVPTTRALPDARPDAIHAAGHQHRLRPPPAEPPIGAADHPPTPTPRHRDRGGRATAFHTRRGG